MSHEHHVGRHDTGHVALGRELVGEHRGPRRPSPRALLQPRGGRGLGPPQRRTRLEPPGARPVIIEDGVFVGSRVIVVEGMHVGREAVLGAGVVLTASTVILDVTGSEPVEHRGKIPARSVVIPGVRQRRFPAGEFGVPCALIIGRRTQDTDRKVSLNQALRDFAVPV